MCQEDRHVWYIGFYFSYSGKNTILIKYRPYSNFNKRYFSVYVWTMFSIVTLCIDQIYHFAFIPLLWLDFGILAKIWYCCYVHTPVAYFNVLYLPQSLDWSQQLRSSICRNINTTLMSISCHQVQDRIVYIHNSLNGYVHIYDAGVHGHKILSHCLIHVCLSPWQNRYQCFLLNPCEYISAKF